MVIWTPRARIDLKAIHDYIAKDAPLDAKKVSADIVSKVHNVLSLPHNALGKKVPEFNQDDLREISIHAWRVIYHAQEQKKFVITLIHKRRELSVDDIQLNQ